MTTLVYLDDFVDLVQGGVGKTYFLIKRTLGDNPMDLMKHFQIE